MASLPRKPRSTPYGHHRPEDDVHDDPGKGGGEDGDQHVGQADQGDVPPEPLRETAADPRDHALLGRAMERHLAHHTRQGFSRTMGDPAGHATAFWNSGMLETTPLTRYRPGE